MKRVNESDEEGSENLGLKKVRLSNGIDESCTALDINDGEERVFVENGGIDSAQADKTKDLIGNTVPASLDGSYLGGLEESNIWDFDINFDLIFGNEEEGKRSGIDLNLPLYRKQDGGTEKVVLEYSQGQINENKVEVIEIPSDDSDNEVEVVGYTYGYNEKGKQIELGMPYDGMETLSLGLGTSRVEDVIGESSLVNDGERRYTREEKGKANVDDWLSLKSRWPAGFDLQTYSDESIGIVEPTEDVEVGMWQPAALAARPKSAERALRQAEQSLRARQSLFRKETAKQFARMNFPLQNKGNESSGQNQPPPTSISLEQLGHSPGPFSEAIKIVRERTSKGAAQQLIGWKPPVEKRDRSITAPFVPSLLDLSLRALAGNAEGIVSLELVPDNLRERLTNVICDTSKMNAYIMNLLVKGCPTEIRIKNCSWLTEKQFEETFANCQTKDLKVTHF